MVHTAEQIESRWLAREGSRVFLDHPAVGRLELLTGPSDSRLRRQGVTAFVPLSADQVAEALAGVAGITPSLTVEVFLLPAPPAEIQGSFASRDAIFLSPGFGPVATSTTAYIAVHELGHVLTWAYLDPVAQRWRRYCQLRGLVVVDGSPATPHASRPREILAEDIRYLFGGPLANASGTIESHSLPAPDRVQGLPELLAGYLQGPPLSLAGVCAGRAFPNPCNPVTTIEMLLPPGVAGALLEQPRLTVYDPRGRQVYSEIGGQRDGDRIAVTWRGRDDLGRAVASGMYLYALDWGGYRARGSVLLVR
jgi:hypothetical protein